MKSIVAFLLLSATNLAAQELTYSILKDASTMPKGLFTSYVAQNGEVFKIGDKVTIGQPSNGLYFNHIKEGDYMLSGLSNAKAHAAGDVMEIKNFEIWGTKKTGFDAIIRTVGGVIGRYI